MAKFIIDIPKEYESDWVNKSSRLGFELCFPINETATNKKYHIPTGLKLESYTEPDRKAIEAEVWEFASMLMRMHPDVANSIYISMNGGKGIGVASEMDYQEAKAKYDEWRKKKEEIRVGDEIKLKTNQRKGAVISEGTEYVRVLFDDADYPFIGIWERKNIIKTGRHFSEAERLLEALKTK